MQKSDVVVLFTGTQTLPSYTYVPTKTTQREVNNSCSASKAMQHKQTRRAVHLDNQHVNSTNKVLMSSRRCAMACKQCLALASALRTSDVHQDAAADLDHCRLYAFSLMALGRFGDARGARRPRIPGFAPVLRR